MAARAPLDLVCSRQRGEGDPPLGRDMQRSRSVARLATDVRSCERRGERACRDVVALLHARGMALGAHVIPVLANAGPVQLIASRDALMRIEMEPALTADRTRPSIPGNSECLEASTAEGDEILLKWCYAESVSDGIIAPHTVGSVSGDDELPVVEIGSAH